MTDLLNDLFSRLFAESREALHRYVKRLVGSRETADEIVQEAFLRTYQRGHTVHTPRAFLFSTARNLAADQRRLKRVTATDSVGDFDDLAVAGAETCNLPEQQVIADEASQLLREAVDRLPPKCHAAFTLKVFHGCSYKEIGQRLGLSPRTVEKHVAVGLHRTHTYLRARYSDNRNDHPAPPESAERRDDKHG